MDITLLELHLHDAEFNAPFSNRSANGDAESSAEPDPADDAEGSRSPGPLFGLLALAGLAIAVRYLRGRETHQSTLDEVEA
ncbi:MAG: hypothetical protein ABEH59_11600 [Halobacteriales archaeon]